MAPNQESMIHYRSSSDIQPGTGKLSLPNFSNFLAGAGHPHLAYRNEAGTNNVTQTHPFSPHSLPTPPATSGHSWPGGEEPRPTSKQGSTLHFVEQQGHHPFSPAEYRRRSSVALPIVPVSENVSTRPYPFTTRFGDHNDTKIRQQRHIIHEEVLPGTGLCYVYDDGSVSPKIGNGEPVNPKWGTTKAGKPRKRLGQACNTCREKKIKCDPSYPKCSQCQKFSRECKFEAPSRPGQKSPKSRASISSPISPYIPEDGSTTRRSSTAPTDASTSTDTQPMTTSTPKPSMDVDTLLSPSSDRQDSGYEPSPSKRQRVTDSEFRSRPPFPPDELKTDDQQDQDDAMGFGSNIDPVHANRKLVEHYLDIFFTCANVDAFAMFPPTRFQAWAYNENKEEQDVMVLYAVLSLATIFSKNPERLHHRRVFKAIAHSLLTQHMYSLSMQVVQSAHLLSLVAFAMGDVHQAYALGRQASSVACWLSMNSEPEMTGTATLYGLSSASFAECKRRTFWAVYITERFGGALLGHPLSINQMDIFLRLPCDPKAYDADRVPNTPFFDTENVVLRWNKSHEHTQLGTMAHLAQIATLCSETQTMARRMKQCLTTGRMFNVLDLRKQLEQKLILWEEGYKQATKAMEGEIKERKNSGPTTNNSNKTEHHKSSGLHILYYLAHMTLNRQVQHSKLSKADISNHVRKTHSNAIEVLKIAQQLVSRGGVDTMDYGFASTAPLTAFAVFMAVDVLTAIGKVSDVLENESRMMQLLYSGIELLGQLAEYWASARIQHKLAQERCQTVYTRVSASLMERKVAFFIPKPLASWSTTLEKEFDLVYGISRLQYLQALGWQEGVTDEKELLEIEIVPDNRS